MRSESSARRWLAAFWILATTAAIGCSDDTTGDDLRAPILAKAAGDSQEVARSDASSPLTVQVLDTEGDTLAGAPVTFTVTTGTGSVTASDTADADGFASATFDADSIAGVRQIRASVAGAEVTFALLVGPDVPMAVVRVSGDGQSADASAALGLPLVVRVVNGFLRGIPDAVVDWNIAAGGGSLSADTTLTDADGLTSVTRTLGPVGGGQWVSASVAEVEAPARFRATAKKAMTVVAGGNNVADRCTSDLWVHGDYAYTGTWGFCGVAGNRLYVWNVSGAAPALVDSINYANVGTISDNEVSADGSLLLVTAESGTTGNGLYIYSLADPAHPVLLGFEPAGGGGLHTGTFADIAGHRYVFASRNQGAPALMGYRIQPDSADKIVVVSSVTQPNSYGIHDQFYRDGLIFASVWNTGLRIYDVDGVASAGTPATPQLLGTALTADAGLGCRCVHNAWWYHDSAGGTRYVFVGQEGPGSVGASSSGLIHVVDISNLGAPVEVASYAMGSVGGNATGVHNFWMDETRGILYAAYYNGGVVALDVTGTLSGSLATREIARLTPGGAGNTYVWGVMLANGSLWASDMVSGFWKLGVP
jgi:hypothetical protein